MTLSDIQIAKIKAQIVIVGVRKKYLQDELLDHYCIMIENRMQNQVSFDRSMELAFETMNKEQVQAMQVEITQILKPTKIKKIMKMTLLSLLVVAILNPFLNKEKEPPSIFPLKKITTISSEFGYRIHPIDNEKKFHKGIDIKAPYGTEVLTTSDGIILESSYSTKKGNYIVIKHDEVYQTVYYHLEKSNVNKGEKVKRGDTIGSVGSSGLTTMPHLHYEVLQNGKAVDPKLFL